MTNQTNIDAAQLNLLTLVWQKKFTRKSVPLWTFYNTDERDHCTDLLSLTDSILLAHHGWTLSLSLKDLKKIYTPNKVPPTCAALYKKIVLVKIHIYGKKHKQTD